MSLRGPVVLAAGFAFASACTTTSHVSPYVTPAPAPLSVTVTSNPPPRADGTVPRDVRFVVQLDGYPDPDTVGYGPVTLRSGGVYFDIDVTIDFVGQAVLVKPRSELGPGTQYELVVSGLVTLDNRAQGADVVGAVRAGTDDGTLFPTVPVPTWNGDPTTGAGGVGAFLRTCAPACHSPMGASGDARTPTRELDLTGDPRDPTYGVIGVLAIGLVGTQVPLARVTPFDPARSVLLRKLIGGSPQADSRDPPYPNMRVDGRRMPIPLDETAPADETLSADQLQTVQAWIAGGAPVD
jgi:hypothetical protein